MSGPNCITNALPMTEAERLAQWAEKRASGEQVIELCENLKRIAALLRKQAEALEPFADAVDSIEYSEEDHWEIWEAPAAMDITVGHLRAARNALNGGE